MLEVGAEALSFQSSPDRDLVRAIGVGCPARKLVGVRGESVLHGLDGRDIVEEEDLFKKSALIGRELSG